MKKRIVCLILFLSVNIIAFQKITYAQSNVYEFKYFSTKLPNGSKFGPHTVFITPTANGCTIKHPKGYKCVVDSCKTWQYVSWTQYENNGYVCKQKWKFYDGGKKIKGTWTDSAGNKGSDSGKLIDYE